MIGVASCGDGGPCWIDVQERGQSEEDWLMVSRYLEQRFAQEFHKVDRSAMHENDADC